jgi:hypothetical protein
VNRIFHKFGIPMIVMSLLLFLLSFSLAWQVLEILGARRMPYEGEMKRFRAEGDFLIRALLISIAINRTQIQRLENAFSELGELASRYEVPREFLKSLHHALQLGHGTGLSDDQLRQRLDKLRELRILPEDRIAP